jgi:hypothetical protein
MMRRLGLPLAFLTLAPASATDLRIPGRGEPDPNRSDTQGPLDHHSPFTVQE